MRKEDITELLSEVDYNIKLLNQKYTEVIDDTSIKSILKPKVKSSFEHLRSCLDYIAQDISELVIKQSSTKKVYFPYGRIENDFKKSIKINLSVRKVECKST